MPSVETEGEPEDIAVHLFDMLNSESPKNRNTWLQRLDGCNLAELLESSRVKAILKTVTYALRRFPGEKVIIFSNFLKFLDIISRVLKEVLQIDCLRLDGTITMVTAKLCAVQSFNSRALEIISRQVKLSSLVQLKAQRRARERRKNMYPKVTGLTILI
jgi:SNF2 family DNA or RNA helicase